jgi:hypothetical protein
MMDTARMMGFRMDVVSEEDNMMCQLAVVMQPPTSAEHMTRVC